MGEGELTQPPFNKYKWRGGGLTSLGPCCTQFDYLPLIIIIGMCCKQRYERVDLASMKRSEVSRDGRIMKYTNKSGRDIINKMHSTFNLQATGFL